MRLVRNTGDRLVILDRESDETMVMMNLDEYENLLEGGCDCGCDDGNDDWGREDDEVEINNDWVEHEEKINHPDASLDDSISAPDAEIDLPTDYAEPDVPPAEEPTISPLPDTIIKSEVRPLRSGSMDSIGAILNEEPLSDVPHEEAEEPFLLEPVE